VIQSISALANIVM